MSIESIGNLWMRRAKRLKTHFILKANDIERAISWNITGGCHFFERYTPEILRAHKWCFIVGCNNSGTTLLQDILEKPNQISTFPHEGQRYTKTLVRAARRGHERVWSEFIDEIRLEEGDSKQCVPRLLHDWMRELSLPINEIIVEKTTANAVRMPWLQEVFPNSYFIGLVRNGYAVTEGIRRKGNKSIERGAYHWNLVNKTMIQDSNKLNHFLEIRYEDLVDKQEYCIKKIADFIGLDSENLLTTFSQEYYSGEKGSKNNNSIINFNDICIKRLNPNDLHVISIEAKEMLEYFNYKIDS